MSVHSFMNRMVTMQLSYRNRPPIYSLISMLSWTIFIFVTTQGTILYGLLCFDENISHNPINPGTVSTLSVRGPSLDVRIWRLIRRRFWRRKTVPALKELQNYSAVDPEHICIYIKRKGSTKTFMMISNWQKTFGLHGLYENISQL